MDLGGILAGAMAGGGKALQYNAQNQLERQREEALAKLERDFKMDAITYEQDRSDQRATAQAMADERQAAAERQAEEDLMRLEYRLERESAGSEDYDTVYGRAIDRANREYDGQVEMAASPMNYGSDRVSDPNYRNIVAQSLRAEARAAQDPEVADQLMRQADQLESRSGGSVTGESGGMGGSGGDLVDPGALNLDFN